MRAAVVLPVGLKANWSFICSSSINGQRYFRTTIFPRDGTRSVKQKLVSNQQNLYTRMHSLLWVLGWCMPSSMPQVQLQIWGRSSRCELLYMITHRHTPLKPSKECHPVQKQLFSTDWDSWKLRTQKWYVWVQLNIRNLLWSIVDIILFQIGRTRLSDCKPMQSKNCLCIVSIHKTWANIFAMRFICPGTALFKLTTQK